MPHKFDYDSVPARKYGTFAPGKIVKMLRELHDMSQAQLSKLSGVPQPVISAIEHGTASCGVERSKRLAKALKVPPATIAFADVPE
jgi:transcriptional regulator with XRE-family HTH domain